MACINFKIITGSTARTLFLFLRAKKLLEIVACIRLLPLYDYQTRPTDLVGLLGFFHLLEGGQSYREENFVYVDCVLGRRLVVGKTLTAFTEIDSVLHRNSALLYFIEFRAHQHYVVPD